MNSSNFSGRKRTAYCGHLRKSHVEQPVTIWGWIQRIRDIGNLVFIDLRDREGIVQIAVSPENARLLSEAKALRMESVVGIKGIVKKREKKDINHEMLTGEIEVRAKELILLSKADVVPFMVSDPAQASEEIRFKYRYLDLRRLSMQRNIKLRHQAALKTRNFLDENGFYEIETPFLTKSTPEGARDYLVPSRVYKGRFFALPQSPQLFKQLLMIAGFDRYFQIVRCFRDEDLRADRQPEFTQIDIEMSCVGREDIFQLVENLMVTLFDLIGVRISRPFPRLTYDESMARYGSDKPDLRLSGEIKDLTETGKQVNSSVIQNSIDSGLNLKGLVIDKGGAFSRSRLDKLNQRARDLGGKGLIWIKRKDVFKSSLKLEEKDFLLLWNAAGAGVDDLLLLVAGEKMQAARILGEIRVLLGTEEASSQDLYSFAWVTDFPLFEWSEEEKRMMSMHHPFTSPHEEDVKFLEQDPLKVRAKAYDLVLNGIEIGGGSTRIHELALQKKIFAQLNLSQKEYEEKFGFFLDALRFGVPPHGGIALGFDRIVMLLAGEESIREVIPFPKTTSSLCLLTGAPSSVAPRQLTDLGLSLADRPKTHS